MSDIDIGVVNSIRFGFATRTNLRRFVHLIAMEVAIGTAEPLIVGGSPEFMVEKVVLFV
jgi:hypothetical protein